MTQVPVSKPERARLREPQENQESEAGAMVPWDLRRLFFQLIAHDGGDGYASRFPGTVASSDIAMIEALTAQLAPRIQGTAQWPLLAVLYLPRLGRVNARVQREPGAWSVELQAEEERTARWLSSVQPRCQSGLAEMLGQPVDLHITVNPT